MRLDSVLPLPSFYAFACLAIASTCHLTAQETESDPWFEEQRQRELTRGEVEEEEEKSGALIQKRASPHAVRNALLKEYDRTPEAALTNRIELLKRATQNLSDKAGKELKQELNSLIQVRADLVAALEKAATQEPISAAFEAVAPYSRTLNVDLPLSLQFMDSAFAQRIERAAMQASASKDYRGLAELRQQIAEAGLDQLLSQRVKPLVQDTKNEAILQKWQQALQGEKAIAGEHFLIERALNIESAPIGLKLELSDSADPRLAESLDSSLRRQSGNTLGLDNEEDAELSLQLNLRKFDRSEQIEESTKASVIPGRVEEEENPDFVRLVAKYEKEATGYEEALEMYEDEYKQWLDFFEEADPQLAANTKKAQDNLEQANQAFLNNPTSRTAASGVAEAQSTLQIAQALERSDEPFNLPKPVKPYPHHLKTLELVYQTPSTIVTSREETPYEYTQQSIRYIFAGSAEMSLKAGEIPLPSATERILLDRERSWIRNVDVNPRDPTVSSGTFSEAEVKSTEDLFYLEFASNCSKQLLAMISQSSLQLLEQGTDSKSPEKTVFALSLLASQKDPTLPETVVDHLSQLARDESVSASDFRKECIASIAEQLVSDSGLDAEKIASTLTM